MLGSTSRSNVFQVDRRQPFRHFREESPRVRFPLEAGHVVVGVTDEVGAAFTAPGKAFLEPEIEHVVQVDVAEHRRDQAPLRGAFFAGREGAVFQDAGFEKPPDDP